MAEGDGKTTKSGDLQRLLLFSFCCLILSCAMLWLVREGDAPSDVISEFYSPGGLDLLMM